MPETYPKGFANVWFAGVEDAEFYERNNFFCNHGFSNSLMAIDEEV